MEFIVLVMTNHGTYSAFTENADCKTDAMDKVVSRLLWSHSDAPDKVCAVSAHQIVNVVKSEGPIWRLDQ